jgi:Raf kinase inhibitor-like YbhB/YbcL family protein
MKLSSHSWQNGDPIPERFAAGRLGPQGVGFGENRNPHLLWNDLPRDTRSLALICHDFDVPSEGTDVNQAGREVPSDLPRQDFFHWVLVDLPPQPAQIEEGEFSARFVPRGKPGPQSLRGMRQGINDYTQWFEGDAEMRGDYYGYDGPFPPWNDSLVHHYVFTLYALKLARLPLEGRFDGRAVRAAIAEHTLDSATFSGTYTLNRRLLGQRA